MNRVIIRGEALLALIPDIHEVKSLRRSSIVSAPTTLLDIRPCLVVVATLQCSQTNSFIRSFFCSLARPRVSSSFFSFDIPTNDNRILRAYPLHRKRWNIRQHIRVESSMYRGG